MAHRMQITLEDEQYQLLRQEAERTGASIAELVRRAVAGTFGPLSPQDRVALLRQAAGGWSEGEGENRTEYLAGLRGPGLGARQHQRTA